MSTKKTQRKFRITLRLYFALASILTLCFACLISCALVIVGVKLFYHGSLTPTFVSLLCLLVCFLSILLGGIMMFFGSAHLTTPLEVLNNAIKKVAKGDFTVKIYRDSSKRGKYFYTNELDELSENVNKMVAELNGMDYMRKDFMSNVSHELKTPIAAITGFTEILIDGNLEEEKQLEYLRLVNLESRRLSHLCENMLRMSRLDYQQIITRNDEIRIDEQIRKCIIMLSEKWSDRDNDFDLQLNPLKIISDADLLMQIWTNLIDNAIKYSHKSSMIQIVETYQEGELIIRIHDNGIGICEEKLPKIFDKFYQCEESHRKQGSGLGLSIVKRILELLNGSIHYDSNENAGTMVTIQIPTTLVGSKKQK